MLLFGGLNIAYRTHLRDCNNFSIKTDIVFHIKLCFGYKANEKVIAAICFQNTWTIIGKSVCAEIVCCKKRRRMKCGKIFIENVEHQHTCTYNVHKIIHGIHISLRFFNEHFFCYIVGEIFSKFVLYFHKELFTFLYFATVFKNSKLVS